MGEPSNAIVHFYRAMVMHADVWRGRLDATTNWAVVTNVGVISFTFTRTDVPHYLLLLLVAASCIFLIMESRRYQIYDIWRRRIRTMNRFIIAPELSPGFGPSPDKITEEMEKLAQELGSMVPYMEFIDALGYRLRRNYGYLFLFSLGSWLLKLSLHPTPIESGSMLLQRATVGLLPGAAVFASVLAVAILILFLTLRAPSEQMLGWEELPSPLTRLQRNLHVRRASSAEDTAQPDDL